MNQTGRESTREPVGSANRTPNGESVETALQLAIDLHGPVLLNRPDKLRLHLEAQCPHAGFDISFLLLALEERVPQSLLAMNSAAQMQIIVPQLQEMLAERRGLNPFAATWAVATWAAALRMDLFGNPAVLSTTNAAVPAAVDAGPRPPAPDEPRPFSADTTTAGVPFSVPFSVPFGIPAKAKAAADAGAALSAKEPAAEPRIVVPFPALPSEAEQVPVEAPAAAPPAEPVGEAIALPIAEPVPSAQAVDAAVPTVDTLPEAAPVASVASPPVTEPAPAAIVPVAPTLPVEQPVAIAPEVAAPPAVSPLVAIDAEEVLPPWAATTPGQTAPVPRRFDAKWGIAGLVAALLVAFGAMRFMASIDQPPAPPTAVAPTVEPVAPPPSPAPAPVATEPPAPLAAAPSIVDVVSDGTLLGDGHEHDVFVEVDPARRDVRSVEATFMAGDGTWEPRSRVIAVQPDTIRDGRIAVGRIGLRTTTPATATFQYVVTSADGQRSTPFVKQFVFAPVAARPPAIADIVVPPGIVAGTPFTLTIRFQPGEAGIASVERTTVGVDGPPRTTSLAGLASPKEGTLRYPVEAIASAARTTFAFTLIDRNGNRSEAQRIVVETWAPKRAADQATASRAEPIACTRTTCGSVVSVREIDRSKTYEVIARMDDRTIQTMVAPGVWKVGNRVRKAGSRFAPVTAAVTPAAAKTPAPPKASARAPVPVAPESPPIFDR